MNSRGQFGPNPQIGDRTSRKISGTPVKRPDQHCGDDLVFPFVVNFRQWLHRSSLEPIGIDSQLDSAKLLGPMKPSMRRAIRMAYDRAMLKLAALR